MIALLVGVYLLERSAALTRTRVGEFPTQCVRECLSHAAVRFVAVDMATAAVCSHAGQVVARF